MIKGKGEENISIQMHEWNLEIKYAAALFSEDFRTQNVKSKANFVCFF